MPTFGKSNARAPKKAAAGRKPRTSSADKAAAKAGFPKGAGNGRAGSNFKPREDGRGGRSEFRAASADAPRAPRAKGAFFEARAPKTYGARDERPSYGRDDRAPRGDRPSYGNRDNAGRSERPSYGNRGGSAGRTSPREMNGGRPDNGRDWSPRNGEGTGAPARKPRYNSDDRAARDGRPSYGDRDSRPRRDFGSDRPVRSFGADRDGRRPDRVERDNSRERCSMPFNWASAWPRHASLGST